MKNILHKSITNIYRNLFDNGMSRMALHMNMHFECLQGSCDQASDLNEIKEVCNGTPLMRANFEQFNETA